MSDFINGVTNASEYLNRTTVSIPTEIDATGALTGNESGLVVTQSSSFSMKELICSLLAGNGINLPNLQICLKINVARLLGNPELPNDIRNALNGVEESLDEFIAHTNINNALARLNNAVAEFSALANMINFCGTPVTPRAIPNVLRDAMGSYLGAGKDILNTLGTMADSDIGGCINTSGKFNANLFSGGLLKQLSDNVNNLANMPQSIIDQISSDLYGFSNDMKNLIEFENNFSSADTKGGSTFDSASSQTFTGVGSATDAENMSFSQASALAAQMQSLYNQLSQYDVDEDGNNIFDYLLTDAMIARLQDQTAPVASLADREPVYDYCGKIIGYTERTIQSQQDQSLGAPVESSTEPGSIGLRESGTVVVTPPSTTVNLASSSLSLSVPSSSIGKQGDKQGDIATDGEYIYIATSDYDSTTAIWSRAQLSTW